MASPSISYADFHARSIDKREEFWREQAQLIDWQTPAKYICDYSNPPFANWFVGGTTNLCYNAVDRHAAQRPDAVALIAVSTETQTEKSYSFRELQTEVERMAAILQHLGVQQGDRVLIYLPMIAEACFTMLACVRIGAIHSVVFGGFAAHSLATRIDDAQPKLIVSADAGMRMGQVVPYKPLLDEAIQLAQSPPNAVLIINRSLYPFIPVAHRDHDYAQLRQIKMDAQMACTWLDSSHPSYTLYTSGTTGKPKGVQRDTGGYAVALAASMKHIYGGKIGETFFSTSDIGWVVGHSYIIYGPLIAGMATLMYEGTPIRPDGAIWWHLVEKYRVTVMFSAPTAIRVLKKQDPRFLSQHDLSSLRRLFLAGEPLDQPTAQWISTQLNHVAIIDNYWQTETGWPILALCQEIDGDKSKWGSPGKAVYGFDVKLLDERSGEELNAADQKGVLMIEGPLPPGCLQTIWRDDARFIKTYWSQLNDRYVYNTFDWAIKDEDGHYFILGRTDDVINVAGHRLGTREIEEVVSFHTNVAEAAVVGMADNLKGQVAVAFVIAKDNNLINSAEGKQKLIDEILQLVTQKMGALAKPARIVIVNALPKTRSGKVLRRALQALCEQRDTGDLTTIDDPKVLDQIKVAWEA